MDLELQRLFCRRAWAKDKVDLGLEYVAPLLVASSKKTDGRVDRVEVSINVLEAHLEAFRLAHRKYL